MKNKNTLLPEQLQNKIIQGKTKISYYWNSSKFKRSQKETKGKTLFIFPRPQPIFTILIEPFGFHALKDFKNVWLSNPLVLRVPNVGYSRNVYCVTTKLYITAQIMLVLFQVGLLHQFIQRKKTLRIQTHTWN